jgi:hypothetical protein
MYSYSGFQYINSCSLETQAQTRHLATKKRFNLMMNGMAKFCILYMAIDIASEQRRSSIKPIH